MQHGRLISSASILRLHVVGTIARNNSRACSRVDAHWLAKHMWLQYQRLLAGHAPTALSPLSAVHIRSKKHHVRLKDKEECN